MNLEKIAKQLEVRQKYEQASANIKDPEYFTNKENAQKINNQNWDLLTEEEKNYFFETYMTIENLNSYKRSELKPEFKMIDF